MYRRAHKIHDYSRHYGEETHRDDGLLLKDQIKIVEDAVGFTCSEVMFHTTLFSVDDAVPRSICSHGWASSFADDTRHLFGSCEARTCCTVT